MSTHTPGPWTARAWRGHSPTTVVCETGHPDLRPEVFVIAEVEGRGDGAETLANARLIAAAPDLLALAQQYASECAECGGTGTVESFADLIGGESVPEREPCDQCADIRAVIAKAQP